MVHALGCAARILSSDGGLFEAEFCLNGWKRGSIYYPRGEFNAYGTGSIVFTEGRCSVSLLWGRYQYIVWED